MASQSPRDLTRLIEQISGSLDLKLDYDRLKEELEKATEHSTSNFNKKRGINAEMRQFKEQKEELERFEKLNHVKVSWSIVVRWLLFSPCLLLFSSIHNLLSRIFMIYLVQENRRVSLVETLPC